MHVATQKFTHIKETFIAALLLTALSDFLLYGGVLGLSVVLLGLAGSIAALFINRRASPQRLSLGATCYTLALLPVFENFSLLSVIVCLGLGAFGTLIISDELQFKVSDAFWRAIRFFCTIPLRSVLDFLRWREIARSVSAPIIQFARFGVWVMPLAVGLVFLSLFADANPVIQSLIEKIDISFFLKGINFFRVIFWVVMFLLIWPLLRARLPERTSTSSFFVKQEVESSTESMKVLKAVIFGEGAILRSLIVFNMLFALQSILDATYLIGGVALPEGMSYANYAHRGAYPLILTTLMAAGFVLIVMREGGAARNNYLIRALVYVWVVQNVLLVLSSIIRLDLYIAVYGLTYWRIAAVIWMGLVGFGLITIIWRLWANKDAEWLVGANFLTAAAVIYACCFVNFAHLIALKNNQIENRDFSYVARIGPNVLPAIDQAIWSGSAESSMDYSHYSIRTWRDQAANNFLDCYSDWRNWSLRNWRLKRYLDKHPSMWVEHSLKHFGGRR